MFGASIQLAGPYCLFFSVLAESESRSSLKPFHAQLGEFEFEFHCSSSTRLGLAGLCHVIFILVYIMSVKVFNYIGGLL